MTAPDVWPPEVAHFVDQARQFCTFVETAHDIPLPDRLFVGRERMLALYAAACALPEVDPDDIDSGRSPAPPATWPGFGDWDLYWEIFDPYVDKPAVCGDLSEDFIDTYQDVRRGLALWDGPSQVTAIWEWSLMFRSHWGDHAIDALRALHRACCQA